MSLDNWNKVPSIRLPLYQVSIQLLQGCWRCTGSLKMILQPTSFLGIRRNSLPQISSNRSCSLSRSSIDQGRTNRQTKITTTQFYLIQVCLFFQTVVTLWDQTKMQLSLPNLPVTQELEKCQRDGASISFICKSTSALCSLLVTQYQVQSSH